jgi:hypothetical protein
MIPLLITVPCSQRRVADKLGHLEIQIRTQGVKCRQYQIERLIQKLEIDKEILADQEGDTNEEAAN